MFQINKLKSKERLAKSGNNKIRVMEDSYKELIN